MFHALWLVLAVSLQPPPVTVPPPGAVQPAVSSNRAFAAALKDVPAHLQAEVPREVDLVEEATLPLFASNAGKASAPAGSRSKTSASLGTEESQTCRRQLIFTLEPRETIAFSLEAMDPAKVMLQFGVPRESSHPLASQIQKAKRLHPMLRAKGASFTNGSDAPAELVVVILGYEKYAYKLKALRSR